MRRARWLLILALSSPAAAWAQNSVYGVAGIGFPEEPIGVHSRGLAGAYAAFDPLSALNPGAVADFNRLAAGITVGESFRGYTAGDSTVSGLRETRFPFGIFGGPITGTPLSFAVSYASYAERTYDIHTSGTEVLRGQSVEVDDHVSSNGSVTDIRGALALSPWSFVKLGAAVHLLGGSSRLDVTRVFSDSAYLPFQEHSQLIFSGLGFSGGAIVRPARPVEVAVAVRVNGGLSSKVGGQDLGSVQLPLSLTGGLRLLPARGVAWSATASWHSWSRAQPDVVGPTLAFDTWEVASGLELGDREARGRGLPLRLGVRYRQLPFSNVSTQPSELVFAAGTRLELAAQRAALDLSLERLTRSGGGADEHGWQLSVGVLVRP